jgi:hypothetical protein
MKQNIMISIEDENNNDPKNEPTKSKNQFASLRIEENTAQSEQKEKS